MLRLGLGVRVRLIYNNCRTSVRDFQSSLRTKTFSGHAACTLSMCTRSSSLSRCMCSVGNALTCVGAFSYD